MIICAVCLSECLLIVVATTWKFVLLGLAFVCLLVGFMLLGMGAMANKYDLKLCADMFIATLVVKCLILRLLSDIVFLFLQEQKENSKVQGSSCCG